MAKRSGSSQAAASRLGALASLGIELECVLCELIVVPFETLQTLKHMIEAGTAWKHYEIPKKHGTRVIHAPEAPLMEVSRGILRHILNHMPVHRAAHGCRPNTSVITNARRHAGFAKAVYTLDLKDAFPSVTRSRVEKNLLPRLDQYLLEQGFGERETKVLAEAIVFLMLVDDKLPQGFPTSPAVLNLVCFPLDHALTRALAQIEGQTFRYTRYVDDITISTDKEEITSDVRKAVRKVIASQGWKLKAVKSKYYGHAPQGDEERSTKMPIVTGLVVQPDGRLTIPRHRLESWNTFIAEVLVKSELSDEERGKLMGIVGFAGMVYEDVLPRIIRVNYLAAKEKFGIRDRQERQMYFED